MATTIEKPVQEAPVAAPPAPIRAVALPAGMRMERLTRSRVWLKALVYGKYGSGKTFWAGTAADVPALRDVLYLDFEGGYMTLANRPDHIVRVAVSNFAHLNFWKDYLIRHCQLRDAGDIEGMAAMQSARFEEDFEQPYQFNTVIIDSLSEANKVLMSQILGIDPTHTDLDSAVENATFEHWGQAAQRIQLLIRAFRAIPINVIFICSEKEKEDERKQIRIQPNLAGQLANDVQGFLDVVGYLATAPGKDGGIYRRLYMTPGAIGGSSFNAKHRFAGQNVAFLDEPNVGQLQELLLRAQNGGK